MLMLPSDVTNSLKRHFTNALGRKLNRKIVIIESDDWDLFRMPSQETYGALEGKGLAVNDHNNHYDKLATNIDLAPLFDVFK